MLSDEVLEHLVLDQSVALKQIGLELMEIKKKLYALEKAVYPERFEEE